MSRKIVFYSRQEEKELRDIANLPKKERGDALKVFSEKSGRSEKSAYAKLLKLRKRSYNRKPTIQPKAFQHVTTEAGHTTQNVVIPFKTVRIEDKNLVFEL